MISRKYIIKIKIVLILLCELTISGVILEDASLAGQVAQLLQPPYGLQARLGHRVLVRGQQLLQIKISILKIIEF